MTAFDFFREKIVYLVCQLIVLILTTSILWILSPSGGPELSVLLGSLYIVGAAVPIIVEYNSKKSFYNNLLFAFESLDKKNLVAEIISPPSFNEGIILYDVLKGCNKAMIEAINKYKFLQEEYREYMELWVHEIKTPIASSRLIAQNNKNSVTYSMAEELEKIEELVEQVLFYSRSNSVEKDYIIKKIHLQKLCLDALKKNSKLFIQNNVGAEADNLDISVYSDAKWLEFILNQILTNEEIKVSAATREAVIAVSAGLTAIVSFIGIYLGIIFLLTSTAILALQQLSKAADNRHRYGILQKVGADDGMVSKALFNQIAIYFMLLLALACIHSVVGIKVANDVIMDAGKIDAAENIVLTAVMIAVVYGSYFIATYFSSKRIILRN